MSRPLYITIKILLSCLIIFKAQGDINAQNENNPFDLDHRLSKTVDQDTSTQVQGDDNPFDLSSRASELPASKDSIGLAQQTPENPFDIQRTEVPQKEQADPVKIIPSRQAEQERTPEDKRSGFLFWAILTMMIMLALLFTLYRSLIGKIYRAFINENILKLLQREQSLVISVPYFFLYILFFLSAGMLLFQLAYYYGYLPYKMNYLIYCILGTAAFFTIKHIILKFLELVFPISKEVKQYSFTIVIFSIILGIILTPFNVFIAFAPDTLTYPGLIGAIIAIIAVYLFRSLRGIFIGSKFLAFHKFHFFMYICIVEIAPCIVLIKLLLLNGANIQ